MQHIIFLSPSLSLPLFAVGFVFVWWWYSSGSIVSDYGLDDRVSIPRRDKGFSSRLCVQTSSEAHPASNPVGTGGPYPGVNCCWGLTLATRPHLELRTRMSRSCTSSSPWRLIIKSFILLLEILYFNIRQNQNKNHLHLESTNFIYLSLTH
jgi:hypothetical protein